MNSERELLESIVHGRDSTASERLRALELLRDVDTRDRREFYDELDAMPDEQLGLVEKWFSVEPTTFTQRVRREADNVLQDDAKFNEAVQRVAQDFAKKVARARKPRAREKKPETDAGSVEPSVPPRAPRARPGTLREPFASQARREEFEAKRNERVNAQRRAKQDAYLAQLPTNVHDLSVELWRRSEAAWDDSPR